MLIEWKYIPENIRNDKVKEYYNILLRKKKSLILKRIFDIIFSSIMLIFLLPFFVIIGILIKLDSKGPIFFRQTRVTQYGRKFKIYKFRTMVNNADKIGSKVTVDNDIRITRVGNLLRGLRLDEMPQLINVLIGEMSFVGTRPEVVKYVNKYNDEMKATLLLPAGITSNASIEYKDEARLLINCDNVDEVYIKKILPEKMKYNLNSIRKFSFLGDMKTMLKTVMAVVK